MNVEEFKANSLDYQIRLLKFNAILQQRITRRKNVEANQYLRNIIYIYIYIYT